MAGLLDSAAFPIIDAVKTLLTLALATETITSHLKIDPPSEARTETSLFVEPNSRAGEIHVVLIETTFFH